ncbi:MAG: hypothetical protein EXX96DRAFT_611090 [Benjaminiella poitrasii]|nr:MAG: hypothetical protein EXX96DRAFT_611090 [Benjaminiella poitrasii]
MAQDGMFILALLLQINALYPKELPYFTTFEVLRNRLCWISFHLFKIRKKLTIEPKMIKNWSNLSAEVLQMIFNYIASCCSKSIIDLVACQLVCKQWRQTAQKVLYTNVELSKSSNAISFVNTIRSSAYNPGVFVRCISLNQQELFKYDAKDLDWDPSHIFEHLGKWCPNIEKIDIIPLLLPPKQFWLRLANESQVGYWKRLKSIPRPFGIGDMEYYTSAALALRDTLEDISVVNGRLLFDISRSEYDIYPYTLLYQSLKKFKRLKKLEIGVESNKGNLVDLEEALNDFPSTLRKLHFQTRTARIGGGAALNKNIVTIKPCLGIKSLVINTFIDNSNAIEYIIHKFPKLKTLKLNLDPDVSLESLLIEKGGFELRNDLFKTFSKYLLQLEECRVNLVLDNMKEFVSYFLKAGNFSKLHFGFVFSENAVNSLSTIQTPMVLIDNDRNADGTHDLALSFYFQREHLQDLLATMDYLLEEAGNTVYSLDIKSDRHFIDTMEHFDAGSSDMLEGSFMNYILRKCEFLQVLSLSSHIFYEETFDSNNQTVCWNDSIREIVFDNCDFHEDFFLKLSARYYKLEKLSIAADYGFMMLDSDDEDESSNNLIILNLPETNLKELYFALEGIPEAEDGSPIKAYIKLVVSGEAKCYRGDKSMVFRQCPEEVYEKALSSRRRSDLYLRIRCKQFGLLDLNCSDLYGACEFIDEEIVDNYI